MAYYNWCCLGLALQISFIVVFMVDIKREKIKLSNPRWSFIRIVKIHENGKRKEKQLRKPLHFWLFVMIFWFSLQIENTENFCHNTNKTKSKQNSNGISSSNGDCCFIMHCNCIIKDIEHQTTSKNTRIATKQANFEISTAQPTPQQNFLYTTQGNKETIT